jgi:NADH dehydrogenase FAD-containing subunit
MRVLLIGAGHAHLGLLHHAPGLRAAGVDLCLVSPSRFYYSGLATSILSGAVEPDAGTIDVARLAADAGVAFHPGEVAAIDRKGRAIVLEDGARLPYDALSLNIGSRTADPHALGGAANVWAVKPLSHLLDLGRWLQAEIVLTGRCPALVVAGTGQAGIEVTAALVGLCERSGVVPGVTLVGPPPAGAWAPPAAIRSVIAAIERRGATVLDGTVVSRGDRSCGLASGQEIGCDALVLATGLVAPRLVDGLDLPVDPDGRLMTFPTLHTTGDARIFATGDCAVLASDPRPCVGVFGVRASPILARNLAALARGRPLRAFRPQSTWLSIMDLGDGTGLALRGRSWWLGRLPLRLKRWLDLGFVSRARGAGRG